MTWLDVLKWVQLLVASGAVWFFVTVNWPLRHIVLFGGLYVFCSVGTILDKRLPAWLALLMSASFAIFLSPIALKVIAIGVRDSNGLPVPLLSLGAWVVVFLYVAEWRWLLGGRER